MSGRLLLDTNIVIALLNGDGTIPPRLNAAEIVGISVAVIGDSYMELRSPTTSRTTSIRSRDLCTDVRFIPSMRILPNSIQP